VLTGEPGSCTSVVVVVGLLAVRQENDGSILCAGTNVSFSLPLRSGRLWDPPRLPPQRVKQWSLELVPAFYAEVTNKCLELCLHMRLHDLLTYSMEQSPS
jgi:hypothetical protein